MFLRKKKLLEFIKKGSIFILGLMAPALSIHLTIKIKLYLTLFFTMSTKC